MYRKNIIYCCKEVKMWSALNQQIYCFLLQDLDQKYLRQICYAIFSLVTMSSFAIDIPTN